MFDTDFIYHELKKSKKYKSLCDDTLHRISAWALKRFQGKEAVKAAKNKLHQVYGAYFEKINFAGIQKQLLEIPVQAGMDDLKSAALGIMKAHTSTAERLPYIEQLYTEVFSRTGKPGIILDLACGLHPFAVPWMNLDPGTRYYAFDIDTGLMSQINTFFRLLPYQGTAGCGDLVVSVPGTAADVVFLLKALPCLEQQEKGSSEKIISSLPAKHLVLSFPLKTLTGKSKGMENYYHTFALELFRRLNLDYFKLQYPNEVFYVVTLANRSSQIKSTA